MQRLVAPRAPAVAAAVWIVGLTAIAIALTQVLSGRAAFLHVGAMLGTIMAGNVALTIVPSQRELVASVAEGRGADPAVSARAKRVSIHNNYFTFPVIALMVSNHFPTMYGHRWNWVLLLAIVASGAAVRHVLNVRFTYPRWKPALTATIAASVAVLLAILAVPSRPAGATDPTPRGRREPSGVVRRRAPHDRSAVRGVSFGAAVGHDVRRGAGRSDVRHAGADRVARARGSVSGRS